MNRKAFAEFCKLRTNDQEKRILQTVDAGRPLSLSEEKNQSTKWPIWCPVNKSSLLNNSCPQCHTPKLVSTNDTLHDDIQSLLLNKAAVHSTHSARQVEETVTLITWCPSRRQRRREERQACNNNKTKRRLRWSSAIGKLISREWIT